MRCSRRRSIYFLIVDEYKIILHSCSIWIQCWLLVGRAFFRVSYPFVLWRFLVFRWRQCLNEFFHVERSLRSSPCRRWVFPISIRFSFHFFLITRRRIGISFPLTICKFSSINLLEGAVLCFLRSKWSSCGEFYGSILPTPWCNQLIAMDQIGMIPEI